MRDVRFTPKSGHAQRRHRCLLSANSGHCCAGSTRPTRLKQTGGNDYKAATKGRSVVICGQIDCDRAQAETSFTAPPRDTRYSMNSVQIPSTKKRSCRRTAVVLAVGSAAILFLWTSGQAAAAIRIEG